MSLVNLASNEALLDQLSTLAKKNLPKSHQNSVSDFMAAYLANYPIDEFANLHANDVLGCMYSWWNTLQQFKANKPKVRVFNPNIEEDGWVSNRTVIFVHQKDMPFLVDSIRIALNDRGLVIHSVVSGLLHVGRKGKGDYVTASSITESVKDSKDCKYGQEALIYIEIGRATDEGEHEAIQRTLSKVLEDVSAVTKDYYPMLDKINDAENGLTVVQAKLSGGDIAESLEFVSWLKENFTFLGYTEFDIVKKGKKQRLEENVDARLGVMSQRRKNQTQEVIPLDEDHSGLVEFYESDRILDFSKSQSRAGIHRNAYAEYVVVKRYNNKGKVVGGACFKGLYTAVAYTSSPNQIPLIRKKVETVISSSGVVPTSHDGKVYQMTVETFPRDELFHAPADELSKTIAGVVKINERRMVRFFSRVDAHGKFANCMVYMPRDVYRTEIRRKVQALLVGVFDAETADYTTYFSESILVRTHFVLKLHADSNTDVDTESLQQKIIDLARDWKDVLLESLIENKGEEQGTHVANRYQYAFESAYRESFDARTAVSDIDHIDSLKTEDDIALSFYQTQGSEENAVRFKIFHLDTEMELSTVIPILENLGLRVIGEHPYKITRDDGRIVWLHDFNLYYALPVAVDVHKAREFFQEAFDAIWREKAESDSFNRLVLGGRLAWREVSLLRAYARYIKQTQFNFSLGYMADTLVNHLEITRTLLALFKGKFDPRFNKENEESEQRIQRFKDSILESLDKVQNLSEDRILRRYLDFISATLRTNFYQENKFGEPKSYISLKFSPQEIDDIPEPRPMFEVFVYSPRVEGVHLRGGKVARGGLRWSDRHQDYRTEVLGLVKAQQVKNAVIVPSGAKGGFICKRNNFSERDAFMNEGVACYRMFISGLLDLADNLIEGEVVPPENVIRHDEDDPYLVVAADKGTATFSDIANEISENYDFWLGDAFASGGSNGYDHKGMGITAKGAWVSVQRHFREIGVNVQEDEFTVVGVGDMGGDVFGNGMLLSDKIRLVCAFNHLHIFIDPDPDAAATFVERQRLFTTPRTTWADFDEKLISKGGGVFDRSAKSITITKEMKARFDIKENKLTPTDLLNRILKSPVDLIWNGGIGTYVKGGDETHSDVGDKANDSLRVNGADLRCKVFGEGGNLGMTQLGRIDFCLNGGRCNTDFIDNAAGVDCSDHEVNIKILLNDVVSNGDMTEKQRNNLLAKMTDTVSDMVLENNYSQTQAISVAEASGGRQMEYLRFIHALEDSGRLDRELEFLPSDDQLLERKTEGKSLCRPELSVLVSYAKVELKDELSEANIAEDEYVRTHLENAFPKTLKKKYSQEMYNHRLLREIVATQVANDMVNNMGITFARRLVESTGAQYGEIAYAYITARDIFRIPELWQKIEALDYKVDSKVQASMMIVLMRLVRRASRWFLRNRRSHLSPAPEVDVFNPAVKTISKKLPSLLKGIAHADWCKRCDAWVEAGVPEELASFVGMSTNLYASLSIIDAANDVDLPVDRVAQVYFALGDKLNLHWFADQINEVTVENHWQARAREAFQDDLEWQQRSLTISVLKAMDGCNDVDAAIETWMEQNDFMITRWRNMINDLQAAGTDFAVFSVALRELLDLAQASQHCKTLLDESGTCPV
ncbi:MAG: NAD-glutamate dehydrogenase [Cellvibrionaceae bacterium]